MIVKDQPERCELRDSSDELTTQELTLMFSRSDLTIMTWRKKKGLPYIRYRGVGAQRDMIRYDKKLVEEWAMQNGVPIHGAIPRRRLVESPQALAG